ncbi:hypothetical protein ACIGA4_11890 [Staphylococcus capitis]|uniref:hypothetical protein n=1 Tax=Staphylococcus capitis TaxID=29388 RepID=UPI0037D3FC16
MKKLIIGLLSSAFILGSCSHHSDGSNDKSANHSYSTKENTESSKQDNKIDYKDVAVSDFFNDRKDHLVYYLRSKDVGGASIRNLEDDASTAVKEDYDLEGIYNVHGDKGFEYVFDPDDPGSVPSDFTLDKLSSNSIDENKRKFERLQNINLEDYNDDNDENLKLHNQPEKIKKFFYTKKNNIVSEDFDIPLHSPKSKGDFLEDQDNRYEVWEKERNLIFNISGSDQDSAPDAEQINLFPKHKMISVEPFTINGKTYAGIAIPDHNDDHVDGYQDIIITEVPKDTKIVMDEDTSDGKVLKYEDTKESKDKNEVEKRKFKNL